MGVSDTIESAQILIGDLQNLFKSAGFQLRICLSNEELSTETL